MNIELLTAVLYPILLIILSGFLLIRLKVGHTHGAAGRGFVWSGLTLIFAASAVNLIRQLPDYPYWFVEAAYPIITIGQFVIFIFGIMFFTIGLVIYFSYWGDRDIEVANHLEKLKLLDNIQQESRFPSPVTELLDRTMRSLLGGLEERAGAVFLLNRSQRKFVLVTGVGLSKDETSLLEYYPYGRNLVSQAIEDETPMMSSDFRSLGGRAQLAASKFHSILVLPLISGREKLGALLFFSEEERHYSKEFISVVLPITEWLSEKIRVNLLNRDLKKGDRLLESRTAQIKDMIDRLGRIFKSGVEITSPSQFAERCLGLAGADEVWLVGLVNGRMLYFGGSTGSPDFTDNFRTALVNALSRKKAVVLNQEGTDESGNSFIARSTLLLPAGHKGNAVLFRNNGGPISVDDEELKVLEMVADVAGLVIGNSLTKSVSQSRSRGLEMISGALKVKISKRGREKDIVGFVARIADIIPSDFLVVLFHREKDRLTSKFISDAGADDDFSFAIGEVSCGRVAIMSGVSGLFDSRSVSENLSHFDEETGEIIRRLFGEKKNPSFQGDYPISVRDQVEYVLTIFGFDDATANNMEQHRLVSLLVGLLNLRIEIAVSDGAVDDVRKLGHRPGLSNEQINDINNRLSAASGYCQLSIANPNLPGEAIKSFEAVLKIIEDLSEMVPGFVMSQIRPDTDNKKSTDVGAIVKEIFGRKNISGDLHMISGRPFTVNLNLKNIPRLNVNPDKFARLIDDAAGTFAGAVAEDETVTVSTYARDKFVHIDISKHRENFPPVEPVADFGMYQTLMRLDENVKKNGFIAPMDEFSGEFAYDRRGRTPSYFSFRFPLSSVPTADMTVVGESLTILAVDDQTIILDLLAAMCQSLGYRILVARDGEEGLNIFKTYQPDLVITDLAMPGISGWELAARIKAISPKTPIILITGWGVPIDEEKMKSGGVDFVLHKPFRLEQLSELINRVRFSNIKS